jgi:hypothetical protein
MFIILLSTFVVASNNTYKIEDIQCFGRLIIQVNNISGDTNYNINNCDKYVTNYYSCSCNATPEFVNYFLNNDSVKYTTLSFRLQYYIKDLVGDDIIDQQNKRIETRTIELKEEEKDVIKSIRESIGAVSFIMWFIFLVLLTGVFLALFFLVLFMNMNKIKRWLGVDQNKPMTFWEIIAAIFNRKSIERKYSKFHNAFHKSEFIIK